MEYMNGYPVAGDDMRTDPALGKGYEARDYSAHPLAKGFCASPFSLPMIPDSEWQKLIEQKTAEKSWASDLCDQAGLVVKNQQSTNYCWINAVTHGMEVINVLCGNKLLVYSAAYAGSIITGGSNEGGYGTKGAEFCAKNGCATEEFWARNKISRQRSPEADANAQLHKIEAYDDLTPSNHREIVSSVLQNRPVSVGIGAWGHEVLITFLVWAPQKSRKVIYGFDNSWSPDWGQRGRGLLSDSYSVFDEAIAIRRVSPATV